VLVTVMDDDGAADAIALAQQLRDAGFDTDLYAGGGSRKLGKQLKYADRRGRPRRGHPRRRRTRRGYGGGQGPGLRRPDDGRDARADLSSGPPRRLLLGR
jgi:hypothetical protein